MAVNKLFYFTPDLPVEKKIKVLKDCIKYIEDNKSKVDDICATSGVDGPQGIYVLNHKEIDGDLKRNKRIQKKV